MTEDSAAEPAQLNKEFVSVVEEHGSALDNAIVHARDFDFQ